MVELRGEEVAIAAPTMQEQEGGRTGACRVVTQLTHSDLLEPNERHAVPRSIAPDPTTDHRRISNTRLNGVSVARRTCVNPASSRISCQRRSGTWLPSAY